ncbi:MAG TPA: aminotransferase class IV [Abditibacteriaceae bacterium]
MANEDARLSALAAGTLLGCGVFTSLGIWNRRAFALDRHMARLQRDAARMQIDLPFPTEHINEVLQELISRENIFRGMARITLTARGDGRWNKTDGSDLSIIAQSTTEFRTDGSSTAVAEFPPLKLTFSPYRIEARRALAGVKSTSYGDALLAWREACARGFDEAIVCNSQGVLCEGTRSNLFWVRDGELRTPSLDTGCLPGIARELVLKWAHAERVRVREGSYSPSEIPGADEVFLTSAASGPRGVSLLDMSGQEEIFTTVGATTKRFQELWAEATA